jgi:prepilin-type N-terminal cleavage/methylation domain-containing protein
MRTNRQSGLSLIEVVVAASLLSLIAALMYGFMSGASSQYSNDMNRETLHQTARRFLDDLANELRDANPSTLQVTTSPTPVLKFQRANEWDGSTMTWSLEITYELVPSIIDADKNVSTADWGIRRTGPPVPSAATTQEIMVCHYVKPNGFTITHDGLANRIDLSLTLWSATGPGEKPIEVTVSTSVKVRSNP